MRRAPAANPLQELGEPAPRSLHPTTKGSELRKDPLELVPLQAISPPPLKHTAWSPGRPQCALICWSPGQHGKEFASPQGLPEASCREDAAFPPVEKHDTSPWMRRKESHS